MAAAADPKYPVPDSTKTPDPSSFAGPFRVLDSTPTPVVLVSQQRSQVNSSGPAMSKRVGFFNGGSWGHLLGSSAKETG